MRAAPVLVAALALAACHVNVEGAPCAQPGATTDCPGGQACGVDLKCSTWAASCVSRGLSGACECGTNAGTEFAADPSLGSAPGGIPFPTGIATPPECRFRKLGDALAAASAHGGPTTVKAYGGAGTPVVFAGETFPLVVASDVTVAGADSPAGETIIRGNAATSVAMVALQGTLQRVHLENVSTTGNGVDMTCGAAGLPTLSDVIVSAGTQKLAKGVTLSGSCGALLERVDVSGASGAALDIAVAATAPITVNGGKFHMSGIGVKANGGTLVFQSDPTTGATEATDNTGIGILLTGSATAVNATLSGVLVARNGGTGVVIGSVPSTSTLSLNACDVHSNATVSPTAYGPAPGRNAGGILLLSPPVTIPTFKMQSSLIYANHGGTFGADEIAFEGGTGWALTTLSCATANAIGCIGTGYSVSVLGSGTVDAQYTTWPPGASTTNGFVNSSNPCAAWTAACP